MAEWRWTGSVSTAFDTAGNWVDGSGVTYTSGYPNSGDVVYYDRQPDNQCAGGNYSDRDLAALRVTKAYTSALGTSGSALTLSTQEATIDGSLMQSSWIAGSGAYGLGNLTIQDSYGTLSVSGTVDDLFVAGGNNVALDGTYTGQFVLGAGSTNGISSTSTIVTIASGAVIPAVTLNGANVTCNCAASSIIQIAGKWLGYGAITTYNGVGGTLEWYQGTITNGTFSNTLDCSKSTTTRVMTNCTLRTGHKIILTDAVSSVTFTNPIKLDCDSPNFVGLTGETLTIS